jgi:hypothetical protein
MSENGANKEGTNSIQGKVLFFINLLLGEIEVNLKVTKMTHKKCKVSYILSL